MTELQLIEQAKENNPESLEKLVLQYKALVCRIARSYFLVSGGDSDDLIQEGTIGFLKAIREYIPEKGKSFASFAALCINNKVKDALKAASRLKNALLSSAVSLEEENAEDFEDYRQDMSNPFFVYSVQESKEEFYKKISELLTPQQFKIINLYLDGYSYKEIAQKLALSVKTVDNSLSSAKERIKKSHTVFTNNH